MEISRELSTQVPAFELFLGEGSELIKSHFVGLAVVSVMLLNNLNISHKNNSPVDIFSFIPIKSMSLLPILVDRIIICSMTEENTTENGHQQGQQTKQLSFHQIYYILNDKSYTIQFLFNVLLQNQQSVICYFVYLCYECNIIWIFKLIRRMFQWLFKNQKEVPNYRFAPTVQVNSSNLYIECTPSDPHTASNIVINTYISKTNRTLLQTRICWSRYKFLTESQHSFENLTYVTGNVYRCEPSDLGSYIQAKITSVDVSCTGEAEVTIGPIRIDQIIKNVVDGALYDRSLRSQIKVAEKGVNKNVDMILTDKIVKFMEENTGETFSIEYNISEPRVELNPKDPTRIYLRFEQDSRNRVRQWLNSVFPENSSQFSERMSQKSKSSSSKSRLFRSLHCLNKIEVIFLTRNCRDLFLFTQKSFICKELMKNSIVMEKVENLHQLKSEEDYHRFLSFMSLRYQIYRLAELAKQYQKDRDQKIKDISELEDSIGEMTLTYMKIIEEKGKKQNVDFNQSYSEISIKREQIMGKKHVRELEKQNEQFKQRVRELNEEIQLLKFFKKDNNDSMIFNQTSNPFLKKGAQTPYRMIGDHHQDDRSRHNFLEINRSYAKVMEENQRLKNKQMLASNPNISQDMVEILESLHDDDQDPTKVITRLKLQNKQLKQKMGEIQSASKSKHQMAGRLNQSLAYQKQEGTQQNFSQMPDNSFYSASNPNQSMMSEVAIRHLEDKLIEIRELNKQMMEENNRLRRQRDQQRQRNRNVSKSNFGMENQLIQKLRDENETVMNQKISLTKKIESLTLEISKIRNENHGLVEENNNMREIIEKKKIQTRSSDGNSSSNHESQKIKKINAQLLEQNRYLKKELQNKSSPMYNSRVIELQNEVKFFKEKQRGSSYDCATKKLVEQISALRKEIQRLKRQIHEKDCKLESQASLIDRLMNSRQETHSVSGKDKSYSQTRNQSDSVDKLKKKIRQLQEEIVLMRRSADALNRSKDISMQMQYYNEEKMELLTKQKEMLLEENERISKMCQKYAKQARQRTKWEGRALELEKMLKKEKQKWESRFE